MPNIDQMSESKYLRKEDVGDPGEGTICTIVGLKQANIAREDEDPKLKWLIKFREFQKPMVLGSTTIQLAAMILGSKETDDWIGKKILVFHDPSVSFGDKLVGGLRFRKATPTTPVDKVKAMQAQAAPRQSENPAPAEDPFDDDSLPF